MANNKQAPFPRALRAEMARAAVTAGELAVAVDVTRQTVSAWKNGDTEPSARHLARIERFLGLDTAELYRVIAEDDAEIAPQG